MKVILNENGAVLIQSGRIYMLFLQNFIFFDSTNTLNEIIKYAPINYYVRNVVADFNSKQTYILSLSSTTKTLINIKDWKEVSSTSTMQIHGSMIWFK